MSNFSVNDKDVEKNRYNGLAMSLDKSHFIIQKGSNAVPVSLSTPYVYYESLLSRILKPNSKVLKIGCGYGLHTYFSLFKGANVVALDNSESSLRLLEIRLKNFKKLTTRLSDMEKINFPNNSFDVVICAGALSYGDNLMVAKEIYRVLKFNGYFICVDSFNHNPIYRINRWLHYLKGDRTLSTLLRMPDDSLILNYKKIFKSVKTRYFGAASFLRPFLKLFFSEKTIKLFIDRIDLFIGVHKSAFKFVMIAKKHEY
jgi:ubiquinone/menaquinone biosynthesis C-methylase UbiE